MTAQSRFDPRLADSVFRSLVDSGFSGVVLLGQGDSVVFERAYGVSARSPDTSSAFWIASITKGFTAAAVLKLQERAQLSVRDTLGKFLRDVPADKRRITIHQLLTHTAGFAGTGAASGLFRRADAIRAILAEPLAYQPGNGYRYINDDYQLLAAIVEIVSGKSWENFIQSELLNPSGMSRTGFWCRRKPGVPVPVAGVNGGRSACRAGGARAAGRVMDDWAHRGADGMSSTAGDLWRWTRALRGGRLLNPGSLAELVAPQVFVREEGKSRVYYGYGARVYQLAGHTVEIMHSGNGDYGHTAIVRLIAPDLAIIVLSNAGSHAGTTWSSYVAHACARFLLCPEGSLHH